LYFFLGAELTISPSETDLDNRRIVKDTARRLALGRRDGLDPAFRANASRVIAERVADLQIPAGARVAGFMAIRSEIDPSHLMAALLQRGHELSLPVVLADRETTIFRAWDGVSPLVKSSFGLSVPASTALEVDPQALLIPLAAFDRRGYRIGYGKGHYDRALTRLEAKAPVLKIGVAFSAQEIEEVPAEPHDRRLDFILTETDFFAVKDI
jgi:5-formyltetrahydrofolate cyclo-ligase